MLAVLQVLRSFILVGPCQSELATRDHLDLDLTAGILLALPYVPLAPIEEGVHRHSINGK